MRRRKNPGGVAAVTSAIAPLLPTLVLVGAGYWLWKKLSAAAAPGVAAADQAVQQADAQAFAWAQQATGADAAQATAARSELVAYCAANPYNPATFLLCRGYQS
jgi:hypothetical protein